MPRHVRRLELTNTLTSSGEKLSLPWRLLFRSDLYLTYSLELAIERHSSAYWAGHKGRGQDRNGELIKTALMWRSTGRKKVLICVCASQPYKLCITGLFWTNQLVIGESFPWPVIALET